jgi:predicted AlkP superfamily pyrophosphatase or phosphodiesterase
MRTSPRIRWVGILAWLLLGFGLVPSGLSETKKEVPPLILISLDGFRWDYCTKYPAETPNLRRLAAEGVQATRMIPAFPSNTFPNHYTLVTGLRPANHGMINNDMTDAATGDVFHYRNPAANRNPRWWGGEPIWITAERQGRRSACYFWVGSESTNHDLRPSHWYPYDYRLAFDQRLETVVSWLKLPPAERPAIVTFYLEETNSAGHAHGPDSPELAAAVKLLDRCVGAMVDRLQAERIAANFVIVSDHGMTPCTREEVVILEDWVNPATVQVDFTGAVAGLRVTQGEAAALVTRLRAMPHVRALLTADLPPHLHMAATSRTPDVWLLPDEGWHVLRRAEFERNQNRFLRGDHGYDPLLPAMGAIFIAHGPSFEAGVVLEEFENIHVYNLLCATLGLEPAANDGDDRLVRTVLRR